MGRADDSKRSGNEIDEEVEVDSESYITFTKVSVVMDMPPERTKWVVNGAMMDIGSNVVSPFRILFSSGGKHFKYVKYKARTRKIPKRITCIRQSIQTLESLKFYFHFGDREHSVIFNIVPCATLLITSHKGLDNMDLNYQTFHKPTDRLDDGFTENGEM